MNDMLDKMIDWENGVLDEEGTRSLFQYLVDTGAAWTLHGTYGRTAMSLARAGIITLPPGGPQAMKEPNTVTFTHAKAKALRLAYNNAVAEHAGQFMFDGNEYLTVYAEYLLDYLDSTMGRLP